MNRIIAVFSTAMILLSSSVNVGAEYVKSPYNMEAPTLVEEDGGNGQEYEGIFVNENKDKVVYRMHRNDILITAFADRNDSPDVEKKITSPDAKENLIQDIKGSLVDARNDLDKAKNVRNYDTIFKDTSSSRLTLAQVVKQYNTALKTTAYKTNNLVIVDLFDITLYCDHNSKDDVNYSDYLTDNNTTRLKVTLTYGESVKPIVLHKYFEGGFTQAKADAGEGEWYVVAEDDVVFNKSEHTLTIYFDCLCAIAFLIPPTDSSSGNGTSGAVTSKSKGTGVSSVVKKGSSSTSTTGTGDDSTTNDSTDTIDNSTTTDQASSKEDNSKDCCDDWICKNLFKYKCCYWLCYNDKCWCWVLIVIIIIFLLIIAYLIYKQIHDRRKRKKLEEESEEDEFS